MNDEQIREYEAEQLYMSEMFDEAYTYWHEEVTRVAEQLEHRGFSPDEAVECAVFEVGEAPCL